jgi:nitroreductase
MELSKVLENRYTFHGEFTDKKVTEEQIKTILNSAASAPYGMHNWTTSLVVITDEEILKQIAKLAPIKMIQTASLIIVVLTDEESACDTMHFEIENYSACVENILLAVTDLGLATAWTDGSTKMPKINKALRKILNVPKDKIIRAVLPIGEPKTPCKPSPNVSLDSFVYYNRFK